MMIKKFPIHHLSFITHHVSYFPNGATADVHPGAPDSPLGPVEKVRQRRSRAFVVLTYFVYAPGAKAPAALLGGPF